MYARFVGLLSYLDVESGVESHLKMSLVILVEDTQETLLEDGGCERIRQHNDTIGRIGKRFHLEQADLIQTSGKEINDVSVI